MIDQKDEIIDFKQFFFKLIHNWYYFLISLGITLIIAFAYNRYSHELYEVNTALLIKEESDPSATSAAELLYKNNIGNSSKGLENKELMIKSYPLIYETLEELDFDIAYYIVGNIKVSESYATPIFVSVHGKNRSYGASFTIQVINASSFRITDDVQFSDKTIQFGEQFDFHNTLLSIAYNGKYQKKEKEIPHYVVSFKNLERLTRHYQDKISISQEERESTVLNISILHEDQEKGVIFLNKLTQNFIENELEEKNIASLKTVDFINKQLQEMRDSLSLIELEIEQYKSENSITDIGMKAQSIYSKIMTLETELAKFQNQNTYYNYLKGYLNNGKNIEEISVPIANNSDDESIRNLINKLINVQIKKDVLIEGGQYKNPAIVQYNRTINQLILNIKEAIKNSITANNLMIKDLQSRISIADQSLESIPKVERELLSIERLQAISENIFIFLLKKRAEAKITYSANVADSKVLEPAILYVKAPFSPNRKKTYLFAIMIGMILPLLYMLIRELVNDTILTRMDIVRNTSVPILGMISRNYSGYNLLSNQNPKSSIYEGFRAIRSNLDFINKGNKNLVYLVTSSVSGEGKTFIAENLAIVFARSGKKTLIIGADLRRPKLYADFTKSNQIGISNFIMGEKALSEVILKTDVENLDILVSGPIPENPSDLLLKDKMDEMMYQIKQLYDIILIDTPPIGLVADTLSLMKYSDHNLYIVRQGYTKKGLLSFVEDYYKKDRLGNLHIVFNDVKEGSGVYGYAYGSGYGYEYSGYLNNDDYFEKKND